VAPPFAGADEASHGYVGIGGLVGSDEGHGQGEGVLEIGGMAQQKGTYGHGQFRIEAGNGFGIAAVGKGGYQLVGLDPGETASLHVGVEPFSLNFSANTNKTREDYIEWLPMGSAGLQLAADSYRILGLVRGGGAVGTLGNGGGGGAYGFGAYLDGPRFDFAADLTRIVRNGKNVDLGSVDAAVPLTSGRGTGAHLFLGLHGEVIDTRGDDKASMFSTANTGDKVEQRGLLTLRGVY
jgi:hypothetical protein